MQIPIESEKQFKELIMSEDPLVIKFFASWCPDCKRMEAFLPSILEEFKDIPFSEIDKDTFSDIAESNDVIGIPSLLVFRGGKKIGHLHSADAKTPEQVTEFLSNYFSS
jgi:thiol-disulfide isomerase/thioredoxin